MARTTFRRLWSLRVTHAFDAGEAPPVPALRVVVPAVTVRQAAGARVLLREQGGAWHALVEVDAQGRPMVPVAGLTWLLQLQPASPSFDCFTDLAPCPAGRTRWWSNAANPDQLAGPESVHACGPRPRWVPEDTQRPLHLTLLDAGGQAAAAATLGPGDEAWTPRVDLAPGRWTLRTRPEGLAAIDTDAVWQVLPPELVRPLPWGLVALRTSAAQVQALAAGQEGPQWQLQLSARSDVLRYYVVAHRYAQADLDALQVLDTGAAAQGRPAIGFQRLLPPQFGAQHLAPALLDPAGQARIVLFEAQSPLTRRARGARGLELHRNGDVLVGHLPQPGADRPDAQFVVHLTQS